MKTDACGDRNFGHTVSIVYADVCRRSMNYRMRLETRLFDDADTGGSSVFNLRLRIAEKLEKPIYRKFKKSVCKTRLANFF